MARYIQNDILASISNEIVEYDQSLKLTLKVIGNTSRQGLRLKPSQPIGGVAVVLDIQL